MLTQVSLDSALAYISDVVPAVKARLEDRNGELYTDAQVETLLLSWLQQSIDELAAEAVHHTVGGDRSTSFNRIGFEQMVGRLVGQPIEQPELVAA